MESSRHLAIFAGNDISTHLLINALVPDLIRIGVLPHLYLTKHRRSVRPQSPELELLAFFERHLLADVVYPYLDSEPELCGVRCKSPVQLGRSWGIEVAEIADVNDPAFVAYVGDNCQTGISIRCYQKFHPPIIDVFTREGVKRLWNLHPGELPEYRGVMTIFRSLLDHSPTVAHTLHMVDANWDSGPVIGIQRYELDPLKAMLTTYCDIARGGAELIMKFVGVPFDSSTFQCIAQDTAKAQYNTFPTPIELRQFTERGLRLVDTSDVRKLLIENFTRYGTVHYEGLACSVDWAIRSYLDSAGGDSE